MILSSQDSAFIDPDERFIIVPATGMEDGLGGTDYYIVFRNKEDHWSKPINLGEKINSARGAEWSPYISPDGKYFFFMSSKTATVGEKPVPLTVLIVRLFASVIALQSKI